MIRRFAVLSPRMWLAVSAGLVVLGCMVSLAGCGGGATATPEVKLGDSPDVGKVLRAQGWVATLVAQPEQTKQVGEGAADARTEMDEMGRGRSGVREAEGMWLIITIEVVNETGEMAFLPKELLTVTDDQGRKYALEGLTIHAPLIWTDERWGNNDNQLVQNVIKTDVPYEGPLMYDVPEDATGLIFVMQGTDDTIDLGF